MENRYKMNNKRLYSSTGSAKPGSSQEDTQRLVRKVIDAMIAEFEEGEHGHHFLIWYLRR